MPAVADEAPPDRPRPAPLPVKELVPAFARAPPDDPPKPSPPFPENELVPALAVAPELPNPPPSGNPPKPPPRGNPPPPKLDVPADAPAVPENYNNLIL